MANKSSCGLLKLGIVTAVVVALTASTVCGVFAYNSYLMKGDWLREKTALSFDSVEVDNAMMSFFFGTVSRGFADAHSGELDSLGLDETKSLKKQTCAYKTDDGKEQSWFDYFADTAIGELEDILPAAAAAKKEELALDDSDTEQINNQINTFKTNASKLGLSLDSYLSSRYGKGVKEADVRRCLELSALANMYIKSFKQSLEFTDSELEDYFTQNISGEKSLEPTKNWRGIWLSASAYGSSDSAKEAARGVLSEWKKGERDEDSFASLARLYSNERGYAALGGRHTDVARDDVPEAVRDWLCSSLRVEGDFTLIESDSGCFLLYFIGDGPPEWHAKAESGLTEAKVSAELERLRSAGKLTVDREVINKLKW